MGKGVRWRRGDGWRVAVVVVVVVPTVMLVVAVLALAMCTGAGAGSGCEAGVSDGDDAYYVVYCHPSHQGKRARSRSTIVGNGGALAHGHRLARQWRSRRVANVQHNNGVVNQSHD